MGLQDQQYAFAQHVVLRLAKSRAAGSARLRYQPEEFAIEVGDDHVLYLGNLFHETAEMDGADRDARIDRFVSAMLRPAPPENTWDEVRERLRPILRPATYGIAEDGARPLTRAAFPFTVEMVAIDRPDSRAIVTVSDAEKWGVPSEDIFAQARANLRNGIAPMDLEPGSIIRFVDDGNGYFSSYLLDPDWLAGLAGPDTRPVAFVPDVDTLIVAPDDPELLGSLFEMAEDQYREATRPLSPQAYTLDAHGVVVPFDTAGPHALLPAARRAATGLAVTEYSIQADWLRTRFDDGSDIDELDLAPAFIATPYVHEDESGPRTVTTWGEGVEYLLPRADYIAFCVMDEQEEITTLCTVPFVTAIELTGITPVPGLTPPRYEARHWPDRDTLAALVRADVVLA